MKGNMKNGAGKLFDDLLNEISSSENSDAYLREQGHDPDDLVKQAIKKLRLVRMNAAAEATESQFQKMKSTVMERATRKVDELLSDASFNFKNFIQSQGVQLSYRNFDEMTDEEIREFLCRHFMLKYEQESKEKDSE